MKRLLIHVVLVVTGYLVASPGAGLADAIYWVDGDGVRRCDLDGSNQGVVVPGVFWPWGIDLDLNGGRVYWTDQFPVLTPTGGLGPFPEGAIFRANLDGSHAETIAPASAPTGIALRPAAGKLYWADTWTGEIRSANLDGSAAQTLIAKLQAPGGIAVDEADGKLYWTNSQEPPDPGGELDLLQRADLGGENLQTLPPALYGLANDVAVDPLAGKLYWSYVNPLLDSLYPGSIIRSNLDGSGWEPIVSGLVSPQGIALDLAGGKLYFTDLGLESGEGAIYRSNLDGSEKEAIVQKLRDPHGIALDLRPIPEPHGLVLLAVGGLTALWLVLRRRQGAARQ
jgi:sugar lactone lactonase YvrE